MFNLSVEEIERLCNSKSFRVPDNLTSEQFLFWVSLSEQACEEISCMSDPEAKEEIKRQMTINKVEDMLDFKKELLDYLDFRLERLIEERYKDTGSFYSDGLKKQALFTDDALGSFEVGFDSGDLRGQYDSYMTIKLKIEKL